MIEFVPEGAHKGLAVERMMRHPPFAGRVPVFVGDDLTDESGFDAAHTHGGWSVLVGTREPSVARHALPGVHAVHAWLLAGAAQPEAPTR